jgi:hypothetical protein
MLLDAVAETNACLSKGLVCLNLAMALLENKPSRLDLRYPFISQHQRVSLLLKSCFLHEYFVEVERVCART